MVTVTVPEQVCFMPRLSGSPEGRRTPYKCLKSPRLVQAGQERTACPMDPQLAADPCETGSTEQCVLVGHTLI